MQRIILFQEDVHGVRHNFEIYYRFWPFKKPAIRRVNNLTQSELYASMPFDLGKKIDVLTQADSYFKGYAYVVYPWLKQEGSTAPVKINTGGKDGIDTVEALLVEARSKVTNPKIYEPKPVVKLGPLPPRKLAASVSQQSAAVAPPTEPVVVASITPDIAVSTSVAHGSKWSFPKSCIAIPHSRADFPNLSEAVTPESSRPSLPDLRPPFQ